ncbi:threonine--tRNA ligase [Candidatus Purcelliella pentastirinorum]|uniref:threonine--tRNA ligase n=1 Tax=Candidatus Purcelliella pentastirinorum TaxID=472834 RepID=UPI00237B9449|nr:threonine--tRNA ligase [Candidatus Purcelliella pentastirinorum]WDR80564.1 threonine--tRNA ligase [Candidatus Purcelliella pentastirinorum]
MNLLKERDHRKINKYLDFYHVEDISPGIVFWHSNGWIVFKELENLIRLKLKEYNYQEVKTPMILSKKIWDITGHLDNFKELIFTTHFENTEYCIKPMNCPCHIQIFKCGIKSYRDLPVRISEFGSCHRKEFSGSLYGLMRLRCFTQDDAHIFCSVDQVRFEVNNCIKMIYDIYNIFGFKNILVKLSTRPDKRLGEDSLWDLAEKDLLSVLESNNINFSYQYGEGAFYGPKIEFILNDCLNRSWQCGTIQLDFILSNKLNVFYINKDNERTSPVIIHRAVLGSIERFIGILMEETYGYLPTWLSPIQVVVLYITDNQKFYATKVKDLLEIEGIRVKLDTRNEKVGFKIREYILKRIPYLLICGDNEVKNNSVSIRTCLGKKINNIFLYVFINRLKKEIDNYSINKMEN